VGGAGSLVSDEEGAGVAEREEAGGGGGRDGRCRRWA
jgi:hypothetical protein